MQRRVSLGACHWGWERRVLSSVAFLHARPPFLWIRPDRMASNTDASSLYVYSVCVSVCLTTSKKLSFGEINRCFVQLVVRNNSQHCDSVSPRASAVVLPAVGDVESGASSGHGPYEWPFFSPLYLLISLDIIQVPCCMELELSDSCGAVTWTITVTHTPHVNIRGRPSRQFLIGDSCWWPVTAWMYITVLHGDNFYLNGSLLYIRQVGGDSVTLLMH